MPRTIASKACAGHSAAMPAWPSIPLRVLDFFAGRATVILPLCVITGLVLPGLAHWLRPALTPLVFLLLAIAMIRTDWPGLKRLARRPWRVLAVMAFLLALLPLAVGLGLLALPLAPGLALALALMSLCPPITSAPALAPIIGLHQPLALVVSVGATLAIPLTLPPLALFLLGLDLHVDVLALMARLGALVGGALAVALLARHLLGARLPAVARPLDGLGVLLLVIFAIAIFDGVSARLAEEPWRVALFAAAGFAAHIAYNIVGSALFLWLGLRQALTVGFLAGTRNMGLMLAVLPADADPAIFLFIATVQFQIYMMPSILRPLFGAIFRRFPPGA